MPLVLQAQPSYVSNKSFFAVIFCFEPGGTTFNDWPLRKQWVLFPLDLNDWGSWGDKTHCFPWGQLLNAYWPHVVVLTQGITSECVPWVYKLTTNFGLYSGIPIYKPLREIKTGSKIGDFEKSGVKLQYSTEEGKHLLVWFIGRLYIIQYILEAVYYEIYIHIVDCVDTRNRLL